MQAGKRSSFAAIVLAAAVAAPLPSVAAERWDWMVAPYLWAANIRTDLDTTVPPGGISTDTSFDDILDGLDGYFAVRGEGQGDDFGVLADFLFLGLEDEDEHPRFHTEADLDARLFDLAGVWSPGPVRYEGAEVFAGLRYVDLDLSVELDPVNPAFATSVRHPEESYADLLVGARYTWAFTDRWGLTLRGDGSWGDTEGTWDASATVQYKMGSGAWLFGYRWFEAELESNGDNTDITIDGLEVGYAFHF